MKGTRTSDVQKTKDHSSNLVPTLGFVGCFVAGVSALLPGAELDFSPNPFIPLNLGITTGMILCLSCWVIAYYHLLAKKNSRELKDLGKVSALFLLFLLVLGNNKEFYVMLLVIIPLFIGISPWLFLRPADRKQGV